MIRQSESPYPYVRQVVYYHNLHRNVDVHFHRRHLCHGRVHRHDDRCFAVDCTRRRHRQRPYFSDYYHAHHDWLGSDYANGPRYFGHDDYRSRGIVVDNEQEVVVDVVADVVCVLVDGGEEEDEILRRMRPIGVVADAVEGWDGVLEDCSINDDQQFLYSKNKK